jgi:hypothetical protein
MPWSPGESHGCSWRLPHLCVWANQDGGFVVAWGKKQLGVVFTAFEFPRELTQIVASISGAHSDI